jgi:alpha-1,2-mannosyltransferase
VSSCCDQHVTHPPAPCHPACALPPQVVMVNSSWTRRHIAELWWQRRQPTRVYPPCDTQALQALPLDRRLKRAYLLSIAQFRPEKDHALQLRALAEARRRAAALHDGGGAAVMAAHLKLVGSCRNAEDEQRIEQLRGVCLCGGATAALHCVFGCCWAERWGSGMLGGAVCGR